MDPNPFYRVREAKGKKSDKFKKVNGKTKTKGKMNWNLMETLAKMKVFSLWKVWSKKRNCPVILEEVKKAKVVGGSVSGIYVINVEMSTSPS